MAVILRYSTEFVSFGWRYDPHCQQQKCSPKNLAFSSKLNMTYVDILGFLRTN